METNNLENLQENQEKNFLKAKEKEELPMIIWLKGDEIYFEEFSWDAKKVMDVLGIKRSRLNQISGQELRVGKARIDRYLRPVYRPEDVEKYLKWTQPTASHKRSTNIIDEARKKLEQTAEELKKSLDQQPDEEKRFFSSQLMTHFSIRINKNLILIQNSFFLKIKFFLEKIRDRLYHDNSLLIKKTTILENKLTTLQQDNQIILNQALIQREEYLESLKAIQDLKKEISFLREEQKTQLKVIKFKPMPLVRPLIKNQPPFKKARFSSLERKAIFHKENSFTSRDKTR